MAAASNADYLWTDVNEIRDYGFIRTTVRGLLSAIGHGIEGEYYRPTVMLAHSLDFWLFGDTPIAFRLTNLAIHLANVLLLYSLLAKSFSDRGLSFWTAGLFAIHPLAVTPVAWISDRTDLLALLCMLVFLLLLRAQVSGPRPWASVAAAAVLLLGLGAKETAAVAVAVAAVAAARAKGEVRSRIVAALVLPIAVAAGWFAWRSRFPGDPQLLATSGGTLQRLALASYVHFGYLHQIAWPDALTVCDGTAVPSAPLPWLMAGSLMIAALVALGWWSARRGDLPVVAALVWIAACLLPSSGVVALRHVRADRYLYCALPGVTLILAIAIQRGVGAFRSGGELAGRGLRLAAYLFLAVFTLRRCSRFESDITLWSHEVARSDSCREGHAILARAYLAQGRLPEALASSRKALAAPDAGERAFVDEDGARQHQALILLQMGDTAEGEVILRKLVEGARTRRTRAEASYHMGLIAIGRGEYAEAIRHLDMSIGLGAHNQSYGDIYLLRSFSNLRLGRMGDCKMDFARFESAKGRRLSSGRRAVADEIVAGIKSYPD